MKEKLIRLLMCMALMMGMFISDNAYSQTGGTLSLNVTTTFTGGAFGARSDFVVWIENSSTTFVKTRAIYGNDRDHLVQWISKTATQNVVDATVGATTTTNPKSYTAILWNGSDLTGTTPYNLLPDGTYKIGMECAWGSNNTIVTSRQIYYATFTKGPTPQTITPNDTVNFTGITLQWTPSNLVVTTSALASNTYFLGSLVSVPFTLGTGTVYRNNVWTAQLSDETGSFASPVTIGTLTSTTAGTISATIPAIATLGAGYRIRVVGSQPSAIGSDNGSNITLAVPVSAPSLTAAVGATVDNPVNITFTDDAAWRTAITAVKIGSTSLVPTTDYVISAGNLQLKPVGLNVLLTTFGSKNITVVATGYADATVTQSIDVGVAAKLGMKTQPAAPAVNGGALAVQPAVYIQDQYGNTTTSTAVVNAIVGSGVWVLGGTSAVSAIAGTTTFSGLTATATANIMGTITFTSVGLTSVTSTSFNIPFVGQSWGNTAGSLSFTINPVSRSTSNYTLNHVAASWIENTSGTFVKTRNRYTGTSNQSHLTSWRATTGSTYSVVDATTAATLNAYNPITITSWLGNDLTGATPYNLLPDGEYKVWFEMSWDDATTEADRISVQFTKGPTLFTASPANTTNFTGMTVIWTPAAANTITTSALAGSTYAAGATVSVPFTIGVGTVYNNNVWTAQLSDATGNFASPINIGTLNTTTAGSISATIPMGAPAGSGYRIRVIGSQPQAAGTDNGTNFTITNGVSPSIAAATAATVDNAFEITYTDDAIWRAAITGVTVGGTTLTAGWVVSAGKITFSPSASVPANLLQASGSKIITIVAAGYGDASVIQMLGPGIATKLGMKTQAAAPATNGALFAIQPEVYVQDQFGNTVISSAIVSAAVGTGSWILGGTTVDTASLGIASFVDLTGSTSTFGGSTITFSSPGLTSVSCNTFYIPYPLSGNLTVGTSGNFTSFTKADGLFSVINSSGMSGNTSISVTSDIAIEDGVTALNQWVEYGGSGYTLTIQPSGGVSRTISGTAAAPLLNFNGADRVTINGLNTGGNALVISNLSTATTAGTSTIQFINDATNNTITNCSILGSSTAALTTNGGNILFNTGTITGNDSITISNCKIGPAGTNLPSKGIYANGSTASVAIANSTVLINNCEIYDFFLTSGCAGIYALTGNTDWSITNNKVYQTATRTFTAAGTMSGIYFVNSTYGNNIQITGNTVGYASNSATGTLTLTGSAIAGVFQGIYMQAMNAAANTCNVNFNVVSDISFTSASGAFTGIYNNTGATSNTININSNQIKNIATITTTGTVQGIYAGSATNLNCSSNTIDGISRNISGNFYPVRYNAPTNIIFDGNTIKNIAFNNTGTTTTFYAVYSSGSGVNETFTNNNIYNISSTATGAQSIYGWYSTSATGIRTVQNNKIYNITAAVGSAVIYGMRINTGSTNEISGNKIYTLSGGITINGINISGGTTNNVFKNKIYDLFTTNTSPVVSGLLLSGGTTNNVSNNLIGDLRATAANTVTPLAGINISGGTTNNIYYNTVNLNAISTGAAFGSSAIYASITPTVNLRNNILVNTSTSNGATGYTCAYRRSAGAAGNLSTYASTSNNNLFYAGTPGANNLIYYDGTSSAQTIAAYKAGVFTAGTIAPRDANSISENPVWVSTIDSVTTYLHINTSTSTQIEGGASTIATYTTDFDGDTRNVSTPDIGADEFAGTPLDLSPPVISYTILGNQLANATVALTSTIIDATGVSTSGAGLPRLYYKVNSGTYSSVVGVSIGSNQYTFTFSPSTVVADVVSYYIVAQDSSAAKNITASPSIGASGYTTDPPACSTPPTTPNTFIVANAFTGTYNVGSAETYTSLTNAGGVFAALNAGVLTGNIALNITSDLTEDGTNALNQWSEANGSGYTMTIQPIGGVTRTISGTVAGKPMINFNGADRVTINGIDTGSNALVISNLSTSATAGTSTIQFTADASNNTITECTILGSSTVPLATNGGTINISTGVTTGNDNLTISNCKIGPAGTSLPSKGICGMGSTTSAAIANSNITVNNCEIYDFFLTAGCAGVYAITGNTDWNITNNKVYQTAARTFTATGTLTGIYFVNATYGDNIQVTGNTIGYASNLGSGTFALLGSSIAGAFQGVYVQAMPTALAVCNINNNVISDISLTSSSGTFTGIYNNSSASSNTININSNQIKNIGLVTTTGTAQAIYAGSATTLNCNLNTIDGISRNGSGALYGIQYNAPTTITFNGDTIRNLSFTNNTTTTSAFYGLYTAGGATNENLIGNSIYNFTSSSTTTQTIYGWYNNTNSSTGIKIVQNNRISNLVAAGGATINGMRLRYGATVEVSGNSVYSLSGGLLVYGMYIYPAATIDNIFKNKIYDLASSNTSSSTQVYGLYLNGGTTNNVYNNLVGDLRATAANAANPLVGIYLNGGTNNNLYFNTVSLNASSTGALFGSTAIYASTTPIVDLRNNIIVNNSTSNGATGFTSAYRRSSATLTTYDSTSANNLFYAGAPGANNLIMYDGTNSYPTLASFKAAVSPLRDSTSISENPTWINTIGSDANFLHINTTVPTMIESAGTPIAGFNDDFEGNVRNATTPDIGADEFSGIQMVACTGTPTSSVINGALAVCAGSGTTLTLSETYAAGNTFQWSSSTTAGGPYTTNLGTSNTQATGNIAATTYYVCAITCTASGLTYTTVEKAVVVNAIPTATAASNSPVCAGSTLNLTGTTNIGTTFNWTGPNSYSSTEQNPSIASISAAGAGVYSFTASNNGCTSAIATTTVAINAKPTASVSPAFSVCAGDSIQLSVSLTGVAPWTLTINNGIDPDMIVSGVATSPWTIWVKPTSLTTYSVVNLAGANLCSNTAIVSTAVTVNSLPVPVITGLAAVCEGTTGVVYTTEGSMSNYIWNVSTGGTVTAGGDSTSNTVTVNWSTPTAESLNVKYTNGNTCTASSPTIYNVSVNPVSVGGTLSGDATVCSTTNSTLLTLTANVGNIIRWESSLNGTLWTSISNTVNTYTAQNVAATTQYRAVVQSGACSAVNSAIATITVNTPPVATITAHTNPSVCGASNGTATVSAATSYAWNTSPVQTTQTATGLAAGTYFVTVSNGICSNSTSVTLSDPSAPTITLVANDSTICAGTSVTFTAGGAGAGTYEFFIDGTSQGAPSASATYNNSTLANGNTITVRGVTAGCTGNSSGVTMMVSPVSNGGVLSGAATVCSNANSTPLTLNSYTGTIVRWESSLNGTSWTSIANTLNTYTVTNLTNTTHYRAVVQSGYCGTANSNEIIITVTPLPTASINYAGTPFCKSLSTPQSVSLTGTAGGVYAASPLSLTINAANGAITPSSSATGPYTVTYTIAAAGGCPIVSANTTVNINAAPAATIAYASSPFCKTLSTDQIVTHTGTTGGIYSASPAGLTIDAASGAITAGTSTAGAYTVTYTIAASGGCALFTTTAAVTVTAAPAATISYAGTPFCKSISTAQTVTHTGSTGGVYTASPAGLTIDAATGAITPSTSTAGAYTVTYTIAASGGCALVSTTTLVNVNAAPAATIVYSASPYCKTLLTPQNVTLTGTTGGVYSVLPAGLTINATNGAITPNTSTAGAYTVTYTMAAAGGCAIATATAPISITEAPAATIAYTGSPFCKSITTAQTVVITGTTGGVFTSTPAGLSINATTGAITPNSSFAGVYTITYTIAAGSGCAAVATTTSVTILNPPSATITYAGSPFCSSVSTAQAVTLTGTVGGTFASTPAGLSINATSGAITPGTSTAGTYTVSYTTPAVAGCSGVVVTTSVSITTAPSAVITYAGSPFCQSVATAQLVYRTGTAGGSYTALPAGLSIHPSTGAIVPATSTAGAYTVTYTVAANGGCSAFSTTANINITAPPTASIAYSPSSFCASVTTPQAVTLTGTGGVFSAPTGLTVNATTGAISPFSSTPGTYTVSYTIPAASGCAAVTTTTQVTITAAPFASFAYATAPLCTSNATPQAVTLTGSTGGVFSSTSGLTINATSGAITPSTSTAGTYNVTYTIAAAGGCAAFSTTVSVVVNAAPVASIAYAGTPYCKTLTTPQAVTLTGATGGAYTALPSGLTINATTGAITPSTSTAGTYTVTYTIAAAGGCSAVNATASVTISSAPIADIAYPTTPFCNPSTFPVAVTLGGNSGGIFTATPAGLNIDANNGNITPITSIAGTYLVTYTLAAAGGCSAVFDTTSIVIGGVPGIAGNITSVGNDTVLSSEINVAYFVSTINNATAYIWTYFDGMGSIVSIDTTATNSLALSFNAASPSGNLKVRGHNDCGDGVMSSNYSVLVIHDGINETYNNLNYKIYPNPTRGIVSVNIQGISSGLELQIINVQGVVIRSEKLNANTPSYNQDIDLSAYPRGIYFVKLTNKNFTKVEKLVLQ